MTTATLEGTTTSIRQAKLLGYALWTVQILLAAAFAMAGATKVSAPIADLAQQMPWTQALPPALVRFIGSAELAGALGLLLPSLMRVAPRLTPLAASGLVTIMTLAAGFHLSRGENAGIIANLVL